MGVATLPSSVLAIAVGRTEISIGWGRRGVGAILRHYEAGWDRVMMKYIPDPNGFSRARGVSLNFQPGRRLRTIGAVRLPPAAALSQGSQRARCHWS
jgi:hypothetical protein